QVTRILRPRRSFGRVGSERTYAQASRGSRRLLCNPEILPGTPADHLIARFAGRKAWFVTSERTEHRAKPNHRDEGDDRADKGRHDNVEIALAMGRTTYRQQGYDRAVLWQAVERAGAHHGNPMKQRQIDAVFRGKVQICRTQRIEGYSQPA